MDVNRILNELRQEREALVTILVLVDLDTPLSMFSRPSPRNMARAKRLQRIPTVSSRATTSLAH